MNATNIIDLQTGLSTSEYGNIGLGAMLLLSEIMPLIKKNKGNGFIHMLICFLNGSSCMIDKLKKTLEQEEKDEKDGDIEMANITPGD